MIFSDFNRVVKKIEAYYHIKLNDMELKYLEKELENFDLEKFKLIEEDIFKYISFFTIAQIHKLIVEFEEREEIKKQLGIESFDELYEN